MKHYESLRDNRSSLVKKFKKMDPKSISDEPTRELIALAFAVAVKCEACIAVHTKMYHDAGGNREDLASFIEIAQNMQAGPGMTYALKVLEAYDELEEN